MKFIGSPVYVRVERTDTLFTSKYEQGQVLRLPLAHGEGRYTADDETIARLEGEGHVVFRYVDRTGNATVESNPNGAMNSIAGIRSARGNVLGLMPHPERVVDPLLGSPDGLPLFESIMAEVAA